MLKKIILIGVFIYLAAYLFADADNKQEKYNPDLNYAQVTWVKAVLVSDNSWTFYVTIRHNDEGWDHYADLWEVVKPDDGSVIAKRVLLHPHDNEQPFTRSLSGIAIPEGLNMVIVRAKCNVHGFGGKEVSVDLTKQKGKDFELVR